jgi:hypothetical protein
MLAYFDLFRFIPGYHAHITQDGKEPLLLLLLAFLITFGLTRLYTRVARIRGWGSGSVGGVHLHHMVVGIVIVLTAGLAAVATGPNTDGRGFDAIGIAFGIGAAFVLDEFALSLYLRDVYWSPEGRTSINASLVGVSVAGLLLLGVSPLGIREEWATGRWAAFGVIALNMSLALATFLKGKLALGFLSVLIPLVGIVSATRLAKPTSPWARRFYKRRPKKLERAQARFKGDSRLQRLNHWFADLVGGAPSRPAEKPQD